MKKLMTMVATVLASAALFGAFKYETTLTVGGYTADETLENFPLLVRISAAKIDGFAYDKCQSDGKDIVFTSDDGTTTFPHEIDEWNAGGESLVWVKIPALTKGMTFRMRFGDATLETAPAYSTDGTVWKGADYFAVYHLGETENIGTSAFRAADSSGNGNSAWPVMRERVWLSQSSAIHTNLICGSMASYEGVIGRAVKTYLPEEDGTKFGYLEAKYGPVTNAGEFSLSGWVEILKFMNNEAQLFSQKNVYNDTTGWSFQTSSATQWRMYGSGNWQNTYYVNVGTVVGKMVYMTVVYSGSTVSVYIDGVLKGSGTIPAVVASSQNLRIGSTGSDWQNKTPLVADEIRLRNGSSSAAWIQTDCDSQTNLNYIAFSPVEELVVSGNTITITATPTERAGEGVTYGTDQPIAPGEVTFTAPAEMQEDDDGFYRFSGWNLTIYGSDGSTTKSSGVGNVCSFTHQNGDTAKLEWVISTMFKVTVTSADETRGTVTGDGYYDENDEAKIVATPASGNSFEKWISSDVPAANIYDESLTLTVTKPMTMQALFAGKKYSWSGADAGDWSNTNNWANGEMPPTDGTADVVFPSDTKQYIVKLSGTISVRSLHVKAPAGSASNNAVVFNGGSITIGAGGLSFDDAAYSCGFEFRSVAITLPVTQNWLISSANNGTSLYLNNSSVTAPEGVVWTIAGKSTLYDNGTVFKNMKGTLRTNAKFAFYGGNPLAEISAPGKIEFFDSEDPIAGASSLSYITYENTANKSNVTVVASAPVSLNLASKAFELGFSRSSYIADNAWRYRVTSAITGSIADKKFVISEGSGTLLTHFPFKQYLTLEGDNSGLTVADDGAIGLSQGVFVLKNENALGAGNAANVYFGGSSAGGYLTGLLTTNGINFAGDLELTSKNSHVTLGMSDVGTTTFSGNITESGVTQLHFDAPKGATVNVTGNIDLSLAKSKSAIINGGGTVVLSGDNASMNQQGLVIRGGTTVLAHNSAAGTKVISLGGAVPSVTTVRALLDTDFNYVGGGWQYYGITSKDGVYTITKNAPLKFDGLTMRDGDVWAHSPCGSGGGKIYRMTSGTTFVAVSDVTYAEGLRIKVSEGANFGGKAIYYASADATTGGTALEDVTDPDVALLASKGVTIANDINVTDNKSAGASMIGVADDSAVTFSGDVTLNRDVTLYAAAGGTATFTGTFADAGSVTNSIKIAGAGTVVLPKDFDWTDRTLDLTSITEDELDAMSEATGKTCVTLLRGQGFDKAKVLQPADIGKWTLSVRDSTVRACSKGFMLFVK